MFSSGKDKRPLRVKTGPSSSDTTLQRSRDSPEHARINPLPAAARMIYFFGKAFRPPQHANFAPCHEIRSRSPTQHRAAHSPARTVVQLDGPDPFSHFSVTRPKSRAVNSSNCCRGDHDPAALQKGRGRTYFSAGGAVTSDRCACAGSPAASAHNHNAQVPL